MEAESPPEGGLPDELVAAAAGLLGQAPFGVALFDRGLRYAWVNEVLADSNGLSGERHVGRHVTEVLPHLAATLVPRMEAVLGQARALELELEGPVPGDGGAAGAITAGMFPLGPPTEAPVGVGVVVVDTTARVTAERELALTATVLDTVLRQAPVGFALLDTNRRVLRVNEALAELDGFPMDAHVGLDMGDLWPDITERIGALVQAVPFTGAPLLGFEVATDNWQGRHIEALVNCYPVVAEGAEPRIGVLVTDVTERNRMRALSEEALRVRLERQESAMEVLQRSLLPRALPEVEGVGLTATYRAAAREVRVGGDWYDVLRPGGSSALHLAVGDVAGHGLDAVETMGQLRSAARGWLVEGLGPGPVLDRLNRLLLATLPDEMATVVLATLDLERREMVMARAGHLPPLLVRAAGGSELLWGPAGPPLGAVRGTVHPEVRVPIGAGDTVVLYTDGLVERRGEPIDVGLDRAAATAARAGSSPPARLVDELLTSALPATERFDDICVLAAHLAGGP